MLTTDTGVEVFYVHDGTIGNPVGLINTSGTVVGAYAYDPYGAYTTTGSTGSAAGINPYRTAGGTYDRGTGWIKYGQRWYNPTTGRFTQQDSIERFADPKQGNRYAYAADNPINYTDPTGRITVEALTDFAAVTMLGLGLTVLGLMAPPVFGLVAFGLVTLVSIAVLLEDE